MRSRGAVAVQALSMNCQSAKRCPLEQCNCSIGGVSLGNKVAAAVLSFKMNFYSTERCSFDQCNCSFGGDPNKEQNCWSVASGQNELSKNIEMPQ